jgi:alpha-L-fucosidase
MNAPHRRITVAAALAAALSTWIVSGEQPATPAPQAGFVEVPSGLPTNAIARLASLVRPSPSQVAWQRREFAGFIHFGMNTFTNREWGEGSESPALFNPTAFDARQWVRVFKDAGMRLLILTAKHHDGFCLWPTTTTPHSVASSPWRGGKGDVVAEVARACREAGLDFGVYVSPWDRHEPRYGDSPRYDEYFRTQLRELLTGYGPIAEVWFDGANGEGPNGRRQVYDWPSYYRVVRALQPQAVMFGMAPDVRWVGTESGYGRESEWSVVPLSLTAGVRLGTGRHPLDAAFVPGDLTDADLGSRARLGTARLLAWYPAETDVSIRPGWFYHAAEDAHVKTAETLVDIYFSSVGRNGVLLLNVPPDARGVIHDADISALGGMRRILTRTFASDLLTGASRQRQGGATTYVLTRERRFDIAELSEDITAGQRVEDFHLESCAEGRCETFARGTTIGHKRLLRFTPVQTTQIRLVVDAWRGVRPDVGLRLFAAAQ